MTDSETIRVFATLLLTAVLFGMAGSAINIRAAVKGRPKDEWPEAVEFRYTIQPPVCLPIASFLGLCAPFVALGTVALLSKLFPPVHDWVIAHFELYASYLIGGMLSVCILGGVFELLFNKLWVKLFTTQQNG